MEKEERKEKGLKKEEIGESVKEDKEGDKEEDDDSIEWPGIRGSCDSLFTTYQLPSNESVCEEKRAPQEKGFAVKEEEGAGWYGEGPLSGSLWR